jgi:hypothetical protein
VTSQPTEVRIVSRSSVPAEIMTISTDTRRLGVNLSRLVLKDDYITLDVDHRHPALINGFHEAETMRRWTDGGGRIPPAFLACFPRSLTIAIQVLDQMMSYRMDVRSGLRQRPQEAAPGARKVRPKAPRQRRGGRSAGIPAHEHRNAQ